MVPACVTMVHSLVGIYGMLGDMRRLRTRPTTEAEIRRFHLAEYVDLLRDLTPESYANDAVLRQKAEDDHGIGLLGGYDDCPAFDRLWKYCRGYAGGSLAASRTLVDGASGARRCRVVMFPFPFRSHIAPMLQLAELVRDRGLAVNVVHTTFNSLDATRYPELTFGPMHERLPDAQTLALNAACEAPFREALRWRWVVRRRGAQAGGGPMWRARSLTGSGTCHHSPLHAQLLARPLPGTGAINDVCEGVGKHYSVNVSLDSGCWAAKTSSSWAPCVVGVGGEPRRCTAAASPWHASRLCLAQQQARGRRRGKEKKEKRAFCYLHNSFSLYFD
uniref:Histone deacetylase domain-containing protein n=1 Tax=Oryza meridionalis TaxID=40149 RepID=A0A0E0FEE3_9ORYZ